MPVHRNSSTTSHEAHNSRPCNRCTCLPGLFAEITDTCRYSHSFRNSCSACVTSLERILRVARCLLSSWEQCDKGTLAIGSIYVITNITQVKHEIKAKLTQSAIGSTGGEGTRNHVQVLANSGVASVLILLHLWRLRKEARYEDKNLCWNRGSDALVVGIVA